MPNHLHEAIKVAEDRLHRMEMTNRACRRRMGKLETALQDMIDEFICGGADWHPLDATALKNAKDLLVVRHGVEIKR